MVKISYGNEFLRENALKSSRSASAKSGHFATLHCISSSVLEILDFEGTFKTFFKNCE